MRRTRIRHLTILWNTTHYLIIFNICHHIIIMQVIRLQSCPLTGNHPKLYIWCPYIILYTYFTNIQYLFCACGQLLSEFTAIYRQINTCTHTHRDRQTYTYTHRGNSAVYSSCLFHITWHLILPNSTCSSKINLNFTRTPQVHINRIVVTNTHHYPHHMTKYFM